MLAATDSSVGGGLGSEALRGFEGSVTSSRFFNKHSGRQIGG